MNVVSVNVLLQWTRQLIEAWGYDEPDADYLARSLVDANLRGVDSHGVMRLPVYAARIAHGLIDPAARPIIRVDRGVVSVDANRAPGQIAARDARQKLEAVARELGVATAVVSNSSHFGAAGYYARELARSGFVALVASNSEPIVVPFGGAEALLGTNPLAFAAPTGSDPISLDMATSTSAMGKVDLAIARHERIPGDWGVDAEGAPTTDPTAVTALLPVGGPKGYGLGLLVEILAGVLSGASIARDLGNMYRDMTRAQGIGHWMLALDVEAFMPLENFIERMDILITMTKATRPLDPDRPILLPGEPEDRTSEARAANGIPLPDDTLADLEELAGNYGVPSLPVAAVLAAQ
jgi:LDH2 family malate/lactate/ureidoglycolate dehydrogenase